LWGREGEKEAPRVLLIQGKGKRQLHRVGLSQEGGGKAPCYSMEIEKRGRSIYITRRSALIAIIYNARGSKASVGSGGKSSPVGKSASGIKKEKKVTEEGHRGGKRGVSFKKGGEIRSS